MTQETQWLVLYGDGTSRSVQGTQRGVTESSAGHIPGLAQGPPMPLPLPWPLWPFSQPPALSLCLPGGHNVGGKLTRAEMEAQRDRHGGRCEGPRQAGSAGADGGGAHGSQGWAEEGLWEGTA